MHSNSEGNNPTLAAQLGVGWNRALPAPFGFENGVSPDGTNDYLRAQSGNLISATLGGTSFSIEFWVKLNTLTGTRAVVDFRNTSLARSFGILINAASLGTFVDGGTQSGTYTFPSTGYYHVVITWTSTTRNMYVNTALVNANAQQFPAVAIEQITLLRNDGSGWYFGNAILDEFRVYNVELPLAEITTNYNSGAGNNPSTTEFLEAWYNFNTAESDTDLWSGSNPGWWASGAWGIRDQSGNGNHLRQTSFTTNNATLGGALTAF